MKLPERDAQQFFEIMMPMLGWLKRQKGVKRTLHERKTKSRFTYQEATELMNILWDRPELMDRYLNSKGKSLPEETVETIAAWREGYVSGRFIIERFLSTGAMFISLRTLQVYLVSGITSDIEDSLPKKMLPIMVETALLPYKGRIIYASTMQASEMTFPAESKKALKEVVAYARKNKRVITTLPYEGGEVDEEQARLLGMSVMPLMLQQEGKPLDDGSPAEIMQVVQSNPNISLVPEDGRAQIQELLRKPRRSEADWDRIKEILDGRDLFTAIPVHHTKHIGDVEGLLCVNDTLYAFTALEECQAFLKKQYKKHHEHHSFGIGTIGFEAAISTAYEKKMQLFIDPDSVGATGKFLAYNGKTGRIEAVMALFAV